MGRDIVLSIETMGVRRMLSWRGTSSNSVRFLGLVSIYLIAS
jgi:hypothetical protein